MIEIALSASSIRAAPICAEGPFNNSASSYRNGFFSFFPPRVFARHGDLFDNRAPLVFRPHNRTFGVRINPKKTRIQNL